ncbi:MAG: hypothetical protein KDA57_02635 [Planctomycetales bacterium]|nr:hypothetical protein [Planctomycetales bacterium]
MSQYLISVLACLLLFVSMPVIAGFGHRVGRRLLHCDENAKELSTGTVDAAILSLLGLLTAFTFSSAYSRYDARRLLIVEEANAIGTAYLRLDLLPEDRQPALRNKFREYVASRSELWRLLPSRDAALAAYERCEKWQQAIWEDAVDATRGETLGDARKLLLPALNEMIDITTTRLVAIQSHPPLIIFLLLGLLSLAASWIVGFGMAKSARLSYAHVFGFAAMASLALYVILDIEYPRYGLITLDTPHKLLEDLLQSMR